MSSLQAGFGRRLITPPLGTPIAGYFEKRFAKGVLDELYASAIALSDGEKKVVIIGADIIYLTIDQASEYRALISEYCNIPVEAVHINASHTHTGPKIIADENYRKLLAIQLRDVAAMALEDLKPAKLAVAEGKAEGISFVRRYRMKNGNVQTNPGVDNPEVDHALATPNETVKLVEVIREGGDDIYLVSFGTHADTIGGELISGDWPGFVVRTVEKSLDGVKCIFLSAPQGDVNHINPFPTAGERVGLDYDTFDGVPRGYEHARHMGRVVAGAVLQICDKAEIRPDAKITYAEKVTKLPTFRENDKLEEARRIYELHQAGRDDEIPFEKMELTTVVAEATRRVALENGPDFFEYTLGAVAIGDIVFCSVPGEMFTELGNRVCDESPFKTTLVCCLMNASGTYFPTRKAYDEGGYEARSSKLAPGYDDIMVKDIIELFESIK